MKILLYPISVIYNFFVSTRNFFFDIGIIKPIQYKIPTIGVGNLSTGGTGKSIIVDYLIELLKKNRNVTTLSRGYNRDTRGLYVIIFFRKYVAILSFLFCNYIMDR